MTGKSAMQTAFRAVLLLLAISMGTTTTLAGPASAALNGNHDFAIAIPYEQPSSGQTDVTLLSGRLDATFAPTTEPLTFVGMSAGTMTGLTKVCWGDPIPQCRESSSGGLSISWTSGSGLAFKFPTATPSSATAEHAIAFFANPDRTLEFGTTQVHFGPTLAALAVDGMVALGPVPNMPDTPVQSLSSKNAAGMLSLTPATSFTVSGAGASQAFPGAQKSVTFQGRPVVAPFSADVIAVPFAGGSLDMGPAEREAAAEGLNLTAIKARVDALVSATGSQERLDLPDLGMLSGVQDTLLNGALLRLAPPEEATISAVTQSLTLIRFDGLRAEGSATQAATSGSGPLIVEKGRVQNAQALVGIAYFQLPWWSYVLWLVAIGGIVARMVMQAPKKNERWDKLRWIGWIAGPLAAILFFWLWDMEVQRVFGVSLLSGGASGPGLGVVALLQFLPLGIIFFAVVTPLRIILQSAFRVLKQGSFMGLATPAAILLGFLLGATLMLSYLDLVLRSVSGT